MTRTFDPVVYWKLRALCTETQRCLLVVEKSQTALTAASTRQATLMAELGLDPQGRSFTLNDEQFAIDIREPNGEPQ